MMNEYDQTKRMLNKIRSISNNSTKNLREQVEYTKTNETDIDSQNPMENPTELGGGQEKTDVNVINNVDVEIHSTDDSDLEIKDDEKNKISQLIDDFRNEVSEIVDFSKLDIYDESAKLGGKLGNINLDFTLSAGDDDGLYLTNTSMLKIDENALDIINKLRAFQQKYSAIMNEMIGNRKEF